MARRREREGGRRRGGRQGAARRRAPPPPLLPRPRGRHRRSRAPRAAESSARQTARAGRRLSANRRPARTARGQWEAAGGVIAACRGAAGGGGGAWARPAAAGGKAARQGAGERSWKLGERSGGGRNGGRGGGRECPGVWRGGEEAGPGRNSPPPECVPRCTWTAGRRGGGEGRPRAVGRAAGTAPAARLRLHGARPPRDGAPTALRVRRFLLPFNLNLPLLG